MKLASLFETRSQEQVDHNPSVATRMKNLTEVIKATVSLDPKAMGATITAPQRTPEPVVRLPVAKISKLEPVDKFEDPVYAANLKRIMLALKQGKKLPPILVRRTPDGYQVIDGHHRLRAHELLNKSHISARVISPRNIKLIQAQQMPVDEQGTDQSLTASYRLGPQLMVPRTQMTESIKPSAKLWTSTAISHHNGYTSEWVEWCEDNMPDWISPKGMLYDVAAAARILEISTDRDARRVAARYGIKIKDPFALLTQMPWTQISQDYDAVRYVPKGSRLNNLLLSTWDVESTAWFNTDHLINPRQVTVAAKGDHLAEAWSNKYKKSIKCNNYNLFDFSIALPDTPYTLNESIKDQLKSWVKLDQTIRGEYLKFVQDKFGGDYATARSEWMKIKHTTEQDFFGTQQQEHQIHKRLLNQLSYMPLATFSQEDWHNLWLLTQHADELPVLQKRVLDKLKQYPQIPGQDKRIRYLTDRLLSGQGKTQRYNTQDNQWQTKLSSHKQRRWGHT